MVKVSPPTAEPTTGRPQAMRLERRQPKWLVPGRRDRHVARAIIEVEVLWLALACKGHPVGNAELFGQPLQHADLRRPLRIRLARLTANDQHVGGYLTLMYE